MYNKSLLDNFLIRCPLAGQDLRGFDPHFRGHISKIVSAVACIALFIIALLSVVTTSNSNVYSIFGMTLTILSFTTYVVGSSEKRKKEAIFVETCLRVVYLALCALSLVGILTYSQLGIGLLSAISGALVIGISTERDYLRPFFKRDLNQEWSIPILDKVIGIVKDITFTTKTFFTSLIHKNNYSETIAENENSSALCVFIHGLKGRPAIFDDYHDAFAKLKGVTLFQPHVKHRGNCSLDEAANPIFEVCAKWANNHPNKPIIFIGISNGARIAAHITAKLFNEKKIKNGVQVHCIAGPFLGTKMMNQPDLPSSIGNIWKSLFTKLYCKEVYDELSWQSGCSQMLIQNMAKIQQKNVTFNFYSTQSDTQIVPYCASLPEMENANYYFTSTEGHLSLVRAVQEHIVATSHSFLKSFENNG